MDVQQLAALLRADNQSAPPADDEPASNIDQLDARTGERVATLQAKLTDLNTALAHATARSRPTLAAQRDAVTTEIQLQKTIQANIDSIRRFAVTEQATDAGAPKVMEWYSAFSLTVTLIWLYVTILRLLALLARNR